MKNAKRKRTKKDSKISKKTSKGTARPKEKQPTRRAKSSTKKKPVKNESERSKRSTKTSRVSIRNEGKRKKLKTTSKVNQKNKKRSRGRIKANAQKSTPLTYEKTSSEIFIEIRAKGGTFKDLARSFGVSEKDFLAHRKFLLGIPGGKRIKSITREDVLQAAKKNGVKKEKAVTIFKGQFIGERHIKIPKRIDTKLKYIHVLYTVEFTYTDGIKAEKVVGQIYPTKEGQASIQADAIQFFETLIDYPYVLSIKLLRFGYRYF